MAGPVLYRRTDETPLDTSHPRRPEGHGRSRARRARRNRRRISLPIPQVARDRGALLVLVIAACASLVTSVYLVALVS
ncbi:MAG: hypothetical protein ACT4PP_17410 [Sporichthyaceae bacterium]